MKYISFTLFILPLFLLIPFINLPTSTQTTHQTSTTQQHSPEFRGMSYTSPPNPVSAADNPFIHMQKEAGVEWTAIIPYGFSLKNQAFVQFDSPRQWWGERSEGVEQLIQLAKAQNMKIMLKPQVWVMGDGWTGEFVLWSEEDWGKWEQDYQAYILHFAKIAEKHEVELFCIGTEYRKAVKYRPDYWPKLIREVRKVYHGKLTYAANWDNFEVVEFWGELDYIGIDAYFPLSKSKTPSVKSLVSAWEDGPVKELKALHQKYKKPILFTEYGYMSCDYTASEHWKLTNNPLIAANMKAQSNALEALYQALWDETWFEGGFLWKWYQNHGTAGGKQHKEFTPQNKPALEVVREWYEK